MANPLKIFGSVNCKQKVASGMRRYICICLLLFYSRKWFCRMFPFVKIASCDSRELDHNMVQFWCIVAQPALQMVLFKSSISNNTSIEWDLSFNPCSMLTLKTKHQWTQTNKQASSDLFQTCNRPRCHNRHILSGFSQKMHHNFTGKSFFEQFLNNFASVDIRWRNFTSLFSGQWGNSKKTCPVAIWALSHHQLFCLVDMVGPPK